MRSKQFTSPRGHSLVLRWQDMSEMADKEMRLSQLCQWVLQAESSGLNYGLELPGRVIAPARGSAHRHACLKALALYD
jgi:uncharacterized protein (DUF58 family)